MKNKMKFDRFRTIQNKTVLLYIAVVFVMIMIWIFQVSSVRVHQLQILESELGDTFTAKYNTITELAVCEDGTSVLTDGNDQKVQICIMDNSGAEIWKQDIGTDNIGTNDLMKKIDISEHPIVLSSGLVYTYTCSYDGNRIDTVSLLLGGDPVNIFPLYSVICLVILAILGVILWYLKNGSKHFYLTFVLLLLLMGILNNLVTKPLSVPDEAFHMSRAYCLTNYILHPGSQIGNLEIPIMESGIRRADSEVDMEDTWHFYTDWTYGNVQENLWADKFVSSVFPMPAWAFIPGTAGMLLARLFHMPYQFILLSGRMSSILFLALMGIVSMRVFPPLRNAIAAILMLPSTIWLCSSYSYDVWNLSFCILFVVTCLKLRYKEEGVRTRDLLILAAELVAFVPIKYVYFVLLFCVFLIPFRQWKNKKLLAGCGVTGIVLAVVMIIARGKEALSYLTTADMDYRAYSEGVQSYTIYYVLHHPVQVLLVYFNTFYQNTEVFIERGLISEFYAEYVPGFLMLLVLILFLLLMMTALKKPDLRGATEEKELRRKFGILFLFGCFVLYSAFLFLYAATSEDTVGTIAGLQGRYFVPFLIFLPYIVHSSKMAEYLNSCKAKWIHSPLGTQEYLLGLLAVLNLCVAYARFVGIAVSL